MITCIADEKLFLDFPELNEHFRMIKVAGDKIKDYITPEVDALFIRTITKINYNLIANSNVNFIGSATAGIDHVDTSLLKDNNIVFSHAPGANAHAVADYIHCCVKYLALKPTTAAIIGCGEVGSRVVSRLKQLGFDVIAYDPPKAEHLGPAAWPQNSICDTYQADLICIHTPLTFDGAHPTYHMIDDQFLKHLKPGTTIINAGRGAVLCNDAILKNPQHTYCLDVFEGEPNMNPNVLKRCKVATPHIAGYSLPAKQRASAMIFNQAFKFFNIDDKIKLNSLTSMPYNESLINFDQLTQQLRNSPHDFENLRRFYTLRLELTCDA